MLTRDFPETYSHIHACSQKYFSVVGQPSPSTKYGGFAALSPDLFKIVPHGKIATGSNAVFPFLQRQIAINRHPMAQMQFQCQSRAHGGF